MIKPLVLVLVLLATPLHADEQRPLPIFDMHLHAYPADAYGPPPVPQCIPVLEYLSGDPEDFGLRPGVPMPEQLATQDSTDSARTAPCADPIWSPTTDEGVMEATIEVAERRNIFGVLSGSPERVQRWREAAPGRFIASLPLNLGNAAAATPDSIRRLVQEGRVAVLGEVSNQYGGIAPDDERMWPYWALAEELGLPVAYHMGPGPPWTSYFHPTYRARLSNPYLLEEVLARHPSLRIAVMHYGSPHIDEMIAMMTTYPQIYLDIGGMQWFYPREYFYGQLKKFIEAGYGSRVMFGSDQTVWVGVIEHSIAVIEDAPFLTEEQKRDILYNNAVRFLRLSDEEIDRHHGRRRVTR